MNRIVRNCFALTILSHLSNPVSGQALDAAEAAPHASPMVITVRLYCHARIPPLVLDAAVTNAEQVFERAGLRTRWIERPIGAAGSADVEETPPVGPGNLIVRILPNKNVKRLHPESLGCGHVSHVAPE